mmetsp:Transcript_19725/g.36546  ORF Transcript_19725/g.36546 Transcript_19725/m.36546 type:complete len:116 (+) Transcript_19725:5048-5395(+)
MKSGKREKNKNKRKRKEGKKKKKKVTGGPCDLRGSLAAAPHRGPVPQPSFPSKNLLLYPLASWLNCVSSATATVTFVRSRRRRALSMPVYRIPTAAALAARRRSRPPASAPPSAL